jgi:hypothetical protein
VRADFPHTALLYVSLQGLWDLSHWERFLPWHRAYLYFFPDGHTERAVLRMQDGDAWYSLVVHPLTGRVEVPEMAGHWDAVYLARGLPLARGWLRQTDVRLNDEVRENLEALKNLPVPLPPLAQTGRSPAILLKQVARFELSEGPNEISRENGKRRVVVTANVRGRDIGSLAAEVQEKVGQKVQLPAGYWLKWGGQFENLAAARQRLMIVVPGCFFLIFLLLYTALGSPRDALLVFSAVPLALTAALLLCGFAECRFRFRPQSDLLHYPGWRCSTTS